MFDGVAVLVQVGIMPDRAATARAFLLAVGCLVDLLRDDTADAASPQVGAVRAGGVRLVGGDRAGPGARAADRSANPDALQHRDEAGVVGGLTRGDDERQRPAPAVGREVGLGGQTTARATQFGRAEPGFVTSACSAAFLARCLVVLLSKRGYRGALPLSRSPFSSATAFSRSSRSSGPTTIPAA